MAALDSVALGALPIGTSNAQAFARNASDVDAVVNGVGSVLTRTGKTISSLSDALERIGYEPPVVFASGLSILRASQTVTSGGLTYHANPASVPFTTNGTFNAAQWLLVSNVTAQDLASTATGKGAAMIGFVGLGAAVARTVLAKMRDWVSVIDYGADPTGVADSAAAFSAAIAVSLVVIVPPGKFRLASAPTVRHAMQLLGSGRGIEPYHDPASASHSVSELVFSGTALNLNGFHNVTVSGFAFKSTSNGNSTSAYGAAPSYQAGTIGIDITNTLHAQISNVSFHGLQYGVAASSSANGGEAAFWSLDNWTANDCLAVVKVGNATTGSYVARDFVVSGCKIALHCGQMMDATYSDGVRIENCRFFQAHGDSVVIKNSPFVTIDATTIFESGGHTLSLLNCPYPMVSGFTGSRAGGYTTTTPWAAKDAVRLINCPGASINGVIEHPGGRGAYVQACAGVSLNLSIDTPYYTNGLQAVSSNFDAETLGAIAINTSTAVNLNCSVNTESVIYAVSCDNLSAHEVTGSVSCGKYAGTYRAPLLNAGASTVKFTVNADISVAAGGSALVGARQLLVPAGKSIYSRSARASSRPARVRAGSVFFLTNLTDDGDGQTSWQRSSIYTNATASPIWIQVPIYAHNPDVSGITVAAGTDIVVSLGIE